MIYRSRIDCISAQGRHIDRGVCIMTRAGTNVQEGGRSGTAVHASWREGHSLHVNQTVQLSNVNANLKAGPQNRKLENYDTQTYIQEVRINAYPSYKKEPNECLRNTQTDTPCRAETLVEISNVRLQ